MAYISFQPKDYFNTKLYTGTGSAQSISSVGFQPDWVWVKDRDSANSHNLTDAVRGATKTIFSDATAGEVTDAQRLTSFDSDGFSVGTSTSFNTNTNDYVSWNWLANGQGSSNTDGSITSTVSANTTAGFSIVTYTGTGSGGATFGHGLGVKPKAIIIKCTSLARDWVYQQDTSGDGTSNQRLILNSTASNYNNNFVTFGTSTITLPSSSDNDWSGSGATYIAYCFAEKKGFSKFGSYTGNGNADGSFIYTGFKPAFVLAKRTNAVESWVMFDNKRDPHNVVGHILHPNNNTVESDQTGGTLYVMDFLSNGFKLKGTDTLVNGSGSTYIYMAFAEEPLVSSNGVPAVAR